MLAADLGQVHLTWLEGLGSSYRMKGFFTLKSKEGVLEIDFNGVAFGGNFGGHNVNVEISDLERDKIMSAKECAAADIEDLLTEVQRKLLNNEMVVEFDKLKPDPRDESSI